MTMQFNTFIFSSELIPGYSSFFKFPADKLFKHNSLFPQSCGTALQMFINNFRIFIPECQDSGWFKSYQWRIFINQIFQKLNVFISDFFSTLKHAFGKESTTAFTVFRNSYLVTQSFQEQDCLNAYFAFIVVGEFIRKEINLAVLSFTGIRVFPPPASD